MRKNEDDGKTEGEKRVIVFDTWQYRKSIIGDTFSIFTGDCMLKEETKRKWQILSMTKMILTC